MRRTTPEPLRSMARYGLFFGQTSSSAHIALERSYFGLKQRMRKWHSRVKDSFPCSHCNATLNKGAMESVFRDNVIQDEALAAPAKACKPVPVNCAVSNLMTKRFTNLT